MRRRWYNPRVVILTALALVGIGLLRAVVLAYWDRPRVRAGAGFLFVSSQVPGGQGMGEVVS